MGRILQTLLVSIAISASGGNAITDISNLILVPTFHCLSVKLDVTGDDNSNSTCVVQYRVNGSATWKNGYNLWHDSYFNQYKGSVVYLAPNTAYEVRVQVSDTDGVPATDAITNSVTTWSEVFTEESADILSNITQSITITSGGSSLGNYKRYGPTGTSRITVNVGTNYPVAITVNTTNVILQNMDFVSGGNSNAIMVANGMSNIVIQNCTFNNYGPPGKGTGTGTVPDEDKNAAVLIGRQSSDTAAGSGIGNVVIQNCDFGPANGGSNSWDQGHPTGPHGIYVSNCRGQIVLRYNRIHGSDNHWFNDGIGGCSNFSTNNGAVNKDSDIYGNLISEVWDDGIECEGRNENTRIFCNVITNSHVAVATAAVTAGPCYKFRNTHFYNRSSESNSSLRETAFKTGWNGSSNRAEYFFLNTVCDPDRASNFITDSGGRIGDGHTLDNVAQTSGKVILDQASTTQSSYDWDLLVPGYTITAPAGSEANAITNTPTFTASSSDFRKYLDPASAGYHAGTAIANFSDDSTGVNLSNPNMGAWDERLPVFQIGAIIPYANISSATISGASLR